MKKYILLLSLFLNGIVIIDCQKDNEYRNIPNLHLNILKGIDEQLQKRIESVNKWFINDIHCNNLSKISAKFSGDIEEAIVSLEAIPKLRLKFKNSVVQKYKSLLTKIKFWNSISYLPISLYMLEKNVIEAEQMKMQIIKLQNKKLSNYLTSIRSRLDTILHISLGPKFIDKLFQNATLVVKSNAQVLIIHDSLKSLVKCFEFVTLNKTHEIFYKYAKTILESINEYDYYNFKKNVLSQYNLLADYEIRNRILNDAKLIKITTDLRNLNTLQNNSDNDNNDDNFNKNILLEKNNYEELKISKSFAHFVFQIKKSINSIEYEIINKKCTIDDQARHKYSNFIDKKSIDSLKNQTRNIEKNCQRIKNLNNCTRDIIRLGESFKTLLSQTVISQYNELLEKMFDTSSEDLFNFESECSIKNQSSLINCFRSGTRLNKVLTLLQDSEQCLNAFGLQETDDFQISNIPVDFSLLISNTRAQKNISSIIAQEQIYRHIFKNIQLKLKF